MAINYSSNYDQACFACLLDFLEQQDDTCDTACY